MSVAANSLRPPVGRRALTVALARIVGSPRFMVYLACAVAAVVANGLLGKEVMWDTLGYHLYAGFSALHDRFGMDYFPAGPQSYFNPYVYVPFYLLATSKLPAIWVASILAIVQSGILWLTYELALQIVPTDYPSARVTAGVCAAALAFANPILIGELGSSYADVTTAELVLVGWLLLLYAIRRPAWTRILGAGLLLGAVSALKLTNAAHALAASVLVPFIPGTLRARIRYLVAFEAVQGVGFLAVAAPWAIRLQHHFGNPFFPLLNGLFRSPQFPTGTMLDYRFIPDSLAEALWRPFALMAPASLVDNEVVSPDLRYALLAVFGIAAFAGWCWRRSRGSRPAAGEKGQMPAPRGLAALGCAFLADWVLWLRASGNGRYFLAMACVAAVLITGLVFRLLVRRPKVRTYLLVAILLAQVTQLAMAAEFRYAAWWDGGRWFEVSMPKKLTSTASLYLSLGNPSNAFLVPFLPRGSGFINIGGEYELGPDGANGERVKLLIHKYVPHLQVMMFDWFRHADGTVNPALFVDANDALEPFGLRAELGSCATIKVPDVKGSSVIPAIELSRLPAYQGYSELDLVTCHVVPAPVQQDSRLVVERAAANVVFDRLESACPELFQPSRPVTRNYSTPDEQVWLRRYPGTSMTAIVGPTYLLIKSDDRPGAPDFLGRESDWEEAPLHLQCGRRHERYYARLVRETPAGPTAGHPRQ